MMKRLLLGSLVLWLWCACTKKKETMPLSVPETPDDTSSVPVDTFILPVDTVESVIEEVDPPTSVDELFDDFIYGFMTNRKFQYSRIRFPLPYAADGREDSLTAAQWRFDRIYSQQESYTVIYARAKEEQMAESTDLSHVVVEWIELEKSQVSEYIFDRLPEGWFLTAFRIVPVTENVNADFISFYQCFACDSVFQREHIREPVEFKTYDNDSFEEISGVVDVDQWFVFHPDLPTDVITNIDYGQSYTDSDYRIMAINSLSSSMFSYLTFKRSADTWILVSFEN